MRGSLIFPFLAELYRWDAAAMAADPDGSGVLTSGFDPDFKEPILLDADDDTVAPARDLGSISLAAILDAIRHETPDPRRPAPRPVQPADEAARVADEALRTSMQDRSLLDLLRNPG